MSRFGLFFYAVAVLFSPQLLAGEVLYPSATNSVAGENHLFVSSSNVLRIDGVDWELHSISHIDKELDLTAQWPEVGLYVRRLPAGFCKVQMTVVHDREFTRVSRDIRHGEDLDSVAKTPVYVAREDADKRKGVRTRDSHRVLKSEVARSGTNDKLRCSFMLQSAVEGNSIKYTAKLAKLSTKEKLRFAIPFLTDLWEKSGLERHKESTLIELSSHDARAMQRSTLVTYPVTREERTAVIRARSGVSAFRPHVVPVYILWQDEIILAGRAIVHGPEYEN